MGFCSHKRQAKTSLFLVVSVLHRTKIKKQMLAFNRLVEKDMIGVGCLEAEYPFFFSFLLYAGNGMKQMMCCLMEEVKEKNFVLLREA